MEDKRKENLCALYVTPRCKYVLLSQENIMTPPGGPYVKSLLSSHMA